MKLRLLLILAVLVVAAGCAAGGEPRVYGKHIVPSYRDYGARVIRIIDEEAGVVCWLWDTGSYNGGMSCLLLSATDLDE